MRRHAGFTLTETLVVVAVLMVLMGLAFPTLATAREKVRQASCASNLSQIGKAVQMYSQDWDGTIPPYAVGQNTARLPLQTWLLLHAMASYSRSAAIWRCPSDPLAGQQRTGSYAYHRWSSYAFAGPEPGDPAQQVDMPDRTGRRGPAQVTYAMDDTVYMVLFLTPVGPMVPRAASPGNHPAGANRLFFDGHVHYRPYPDLKGQRDGQNMRSLTPPP